MSRIYHIRRIRTQANIHIRELHARLIRLREQSGISGGRDDEGVYCGLMPVDVSVDLPHIRRDHQAVGREVSRVSSAVMARASLPA